VDRIKRSARHEIESARVTQADPVMLEVFGGGVSDVEPDRVRPAPEQRPAHPRLRGQ
jgi:hypothetical protein